MIELPDPQAAAKWCAQQRADGRSIGYVPTMGALHDGHLALVQRAVRENDATCVSIFVNPLQFNNPDDLANYPRDDARDLALLNDAGCEMVYGGTLANFFPEVADPADITLRDIKAIDAGTAAHGLEGEFRPGHLQGVCAIVARLFATVGACRAYFGEKDFQQLLVVEELARRFDGIDVIACPTVRDGDGLALSSRNVRLDDDARVAALKIYRALIAAKAAWAGGERDAKKLEWLMTEQLNDAHIEVEYAAIRDPQNWGDWTDTSHELHRARALIAAWVGGVRLIDNIDLARHD